ncbi:metalloregulator ArsR/SmtB family transcription factor [Asticcacaulis sp. EMRT-3]|uniref:ArsR/SmtB family transcription factor n=1 Tax=Asticcacaulis sp. EMRT-3 TaxID=3040349 RepID=UPI0024AFA8AD|nr:metalloregulator ArsR/SmtB family transcription factor [Asticcacaulis sp. EMRT-3]MDI7774524.1 metalloregulator ArsR/SmtB family transcription factor [Asticcacaulis sp. EMRT-3]
MTVTLDQTLAALADPNRRQVIEILCAQPLPAGELARRIGLSPAALSRHLRVLKTLGMISEVPLHTDARVRVYGLRPQPMADLKVWLGHTETLWTRQVERFKSDA